MKIIVDIEGLDLKEFFDEMRTVICDAINNESYDKADLFDKDSDYVIGAEDAKGLIAKILREYCIKLIKASASEVIA